MNAGIVRVADAGIVAARGEDEVNAGIVCAADAGIVRVEEHCS
ncbi:MAG: hypothetical protein ACKV2T_23855 [Kofleriaceae bacterium]